MSDRIRWLMHQDVEILLLDVTGLAPEDIGFDEFLEEAKTQIAARPPRSVRTLFDARGTYFNREIIEKLKDFTVHNKPYVIASAVVGIRGLMALALDVVSKVSGRTFFQCDTREEALDWLSRH